MEDYTDEKLIADYLKGNEKMLEILITRYLKPIYSFVYRFIGDGEAAEDITQEVFVKVWRNLRKFNPRRQQKRLAPHRTNEVNSGAGFKTWIFSIAKNTSIDWLKKKRAIPFSHFENVKGENALTETLVDSFLLPNEIFEQDGLVKKVQAAINQLALKYRFVLFLRYNNYSTPLRDKSLTGLTFREIAEILGEPLHTVKSRHRRALLALKKLLAN